MDRREALKKIGVGGVTLAGASAVMSSPAFAFTQPTSVSAPTITISPATTSTASVDIFPQGTCPGSSDGLLISGSAVDEIRAPNGTLLGTTVHPFTDREVAASFTVTRPTGTWNNNDSITVTVSNVTYKCKYTNGNSAAVSAPGATLTRRYNNGAWIV